jgi:hypothetical protein
MIFLKLQNEGFISMKGIPYFLFEKTKTLHSLIIRDFLLLKNNEEKSKVLLYCFRTDRLFLAAASGLSGRLASRK